VKGIEAGLASSPPRPQRVGRAARAAAPHIAPVPTRDAAGMAGTTAAHRPRWRADARHHRLKASSLGAQTPGWAIRHHRRSTSVQRTPGTPRHVQRLTRLTAKSEPAVAQFHFGTAVEGPERNRRARKNGSHSRPCSAVAGQRTRRRLSQDGPVSHRTQVSASRTFSGRTNGHNWAYEGASAA